MALAKDIADVYFPFMEDCKKAGFTIEQSEFLFHLNFNRLTK